MGRHHVTRPGCVCGPPYSYGELDHYRALMASDLAGRRALVTGGASGIGRACAVRLAAAGAEVLVADRDAEAAKAVAELVGGTPVAIDLSDLDAIDALDLDVDVLVNNAGLQHVAPLHEFPVDRFSYILRLMLEAPFRLVRGALPHMYEEGWGRIVNISSIHGLRASPFKSAYVTAKHGLEGCPRSSPWRAPSTGSPPTASTPPTCAPRWSRARSPTRPRRTG